MSKVNWLSAKIEGLKVRLNYWEPGRHVTIVKDSYYLQAFRDTQGNLWDCNDDNGYYWEVYEEVNKEKSKKEKKIIKLAPALLKDPSNGHYHLSTYLYDSLEIAKDTFEDEFLKWPAGDFIEVEVEE